MPRGRKPFSEAAMSDVDRFAKVKAEKIARGERRLSNYINAEASAALEKLTGGSVERGAIKAAIEDALISRAKQKRL